eukprot:scaffold14290_cov125-Isochrysis_galbana.AAC.12
MDWMCRFPRGRRAGMADSVTERMASSSFGLASTSAVQHAEARWVKYDLSVGLQMHQCEPWPSPPWEDAPVWQTELAYFFGDPVDIKRIAASSKRAFLSLG